MPITRDPDFPAEAANLMHVFNRCADGQDANVVLNASLQMVAAAIGYICKRRQVPLEDALAYTEHVSNTLQRIVTENWARTPSADDVEVKLG